MSSSKWTLRVCLLTCLLNWSVSKVRTVQPGEDVLLQCQGPKGADIVFVQWIRPDLESEGSVFFFRDDRTDENYQHPSFHGRVELRDPQMKGGDVSVILKNVNNKDTGTYECYVRSKGCRSELIHRINLEVKFSDQQQITVKTGDDVTLECLDHRGGDIDLLEWRRLDPEKGVFICIYRNTYEHPQHPSFHGRVKLRDPQMKDGNVSVILKNVTINDTGTYECYVRNSNTPPQSIININLTVIDPGGDKYGENQDGGKKHGHVGLVAGLSVVIGLVVVVVVVVVVSGCGFVGVIYKGSKEFQKQIYQPSADKAAGHELQDLTPEPKKKMEEEEEEEEEEKEDEEETRVEK